jgi:hypothetical protein
LAFNIRYATKPEDLFYNVPDTLPVLRRHGKSPFQYKVTQQHIETPGMKIDVQSIMSSNWFDEESHNTDLPYMPQEILKLIHNFGYSMLLDDKHDIGKFSYSNRPGYPPHPSGIHHWYIGAAMMTLAQVGGMLQKMKEFMEVGLEAGSGLPLPGLAEESPLVASRITQPALQSPRTASSHIPAITYNQPPSYTPSLPLVQPTRAEKLPQLSDNTQMSSQPQLTSKSVQVPNPLRKILKG